MRAITIFALAALAGCMEGPHPGPEPSAELDHSPYRPVSLVGEDLHRSDVLGLPFDLDIVGAHLVVLDQATDSVVHVFRRTDGALVRSFGRRGGGPGEYRGAWSVDPVPGSHREFWVWDVGLRRLTHVDLEADFAPGVRAGTRSLNVDVEAPLLDPRWIGNGLVGLGFFEQGRLAFLDTTGQLLRTAGETPPGDENVPPNVRQQAYQSSLAVRPDRSLLAVATRHFDHLEIYRPDGTLVARNDKPFGFEPRYWVRERQGQTGMATDGTLRFGYIDVAADHQRVFALFSGRTRNGFPGEANFGEYVHVYDWNARLVEVFRLDAAAISIAVAPGENALYAVVHEPVPRIVRYALPGPRGAGLLAELGEEAAREPGPGRAAGR